MLGIKKSSDNKVAGIENKETKIMITDATPIDETGAVYRSSELITFGGYPSVYYDVEVTVFETGDAHAIVDGELDELWFSGEETLDEVIDATWEYAMEWINDMRKGVK